MDNITKPTRINRYHMELFSGTFRLRLGSIASEHTTEIGKCLDDLGSQVTLGYSWCCRSGTPTLFSIMQWNAANLSVRETTDLGDKDWSVVHAFYASAGGFIIQNTDCPAFPINATSIHYLRSTGWVKEVTITREDIWDRSKADLFTKGFAMLQTSWLLIQCTARLVQQLSITPIELFTLAFLVPTVATGFLWASKPQNVQELTVITTE